MTVTYGEWATTFLQECSLSVTNITLTATLAWMVSEYRIEVPLDQRALNNPLDTKEPYPNATDFNSVGVKNYATMADGLSATLRTIENGNYSAILEAYVSATNPFDISNAIVASPWGSKPSFAIVHYVQDNYDIVRNAPTNVTEGTTTVTTTTEGSTSGEVESATGTPLAAPIVSSCPSSTGRGYYLVGADGGVFAFGDAKYHGSIPELVAAKQSEPVTSPVVSIMAVDNNGYWLVCADGAVYAFGAAQFQGAI